MLFTRACSTASALAYMAKRRAMLAGDMIETLGTAVADLFDATTSSASDTRGQTLNRQDI